MLTSPVNFLSFIHLEMVTRNISSLIFPGIKMISLYIPGFSFLTLFEDSSDMFFIPVLTQDNVSILLVDHLTILAYLIQVSLYLTYISLYIWGVSSSLFKGADFKMHSWAWRWWSLKINQHFWPPFLSRIISHGILQSRSVKRPKSLKNSTVVILLFGLFFSLWILTPVVRGHCSQGSSQPIHSEHFIFVCEYHIQ